MNQLHALNWNAGVAPPNTALQITFPLPTGAQPINIRLADIAAVAVGAGVITCITYPTNLQACVCPSCGKAH